MSEWLIAADELVESFARLGERGAARFERVTIWPEDRLRTAGAHRSVTDQQIENGADAERADEPDGNVAIGIARLLRSGRDRIEADIGEEDGRCGADDADA